MGDYEEEIDPLGNVRKIHYLSAAVMVQENGADKLYYTYSDKQGSLLALTDASGTVVERYAYDPWGARRNPDNWTLKDARTKWITNRGYTGHEHLDAFGVINMNGRVYDPLTAQFFSPDPYLQAPGNWLNYNRYGYCYNNPFKYTDPSGEYILSLICAVVPGLQVFLPAAIYADAALWGGTLNVISNSSKINSFGTGLAYFGSGAAGAVISAAGNPLAGGYVTAAGNFATDAATGHVPTLDNPGDLLKYAGGLALDGMGAAGIGQLATKAGAALTAKYVTSFAGTGTFVRTGGAAADAVYGMSGLEVTITRTSIGAGDVASNLARGVKGLAGAEKGTTVLGHYPDYVNMANKLGANRFQIPPSIWDKMTFGEQWAANQKYLNRMILRDDNIRLATELSKIKPGSYYEMELKYLFDNGYSLSNDGLWLIK